MLQFIAGTGSRYTLAEEMQMAIEGGCAWVQLHPGDLTDAELREASADFIPLCRENATILTIEDRPELAKELGIHGVHLTDNGCDAGAVREQLGPEAIIGVQVHSPQAVLTLRAKDIDYVTVDPGLTHDETASLIRTVRDAGCDMPIVVTGDITPGDIPAVRETGASGIAVGAPISDAADPVAETQKYLAALQ